MSREASPIRLPAPSPAAQGKDSTVEAYAFPSPAQRRKSLPRTRSGVPGGRMGALFAAYEASDQTLR